MFEYVQELFRNNQILSGVIGGSFFMSVLYSLKWLPETLWEVITWRFTTKLTVYSEDSLFDKVTEWLSTLDYMKKARRVSLATSQGGRTEEIYCSIGLGKHFLWYKGRPLFIKRSHLENKGGAWKRPEDIEITTLGTSTKFMHELIKTISESGGFLGNQLSIYLYRSGWWALANRRAKRAVDTVVLPKLQKSMLFKDIDEFLSRQEWYQKRGVPYRRGYLFEGPPGCGKTSIVMAIASHYNRPIYCLNIGSLENDNDLFQAVLSVPQRGILLIEDIDAAQTNRDEEPPKPQVVAPAPSSESSPPKSAPQKVTLSGLLNAVDGVFLPEGRILFMTTNHPDKIDAALHRRGRSDVRVHFGEFGVEEVETMCRQFFDEDGAVIAKTIPVPITPSDLQERLLSHGPARLQVAHS